MSCLLETIEGKVNAVLTFGREHLLYDIKNAAYIEGSIMEDAEEKGVGVHSRHMVQDIGEEGNVDVVTRVMDLTISQCREMLYPFTKHDLHRLELGNKLRETAVYGIVLTLPQGFSQTTLDLLERLIHELMVAKAIAEWLRITHPSKSQSWAERAEELAGEIRGSLNARMGRNRIRQHWL